MLLLLKVSFHAKHLEFVTFLSLQLSLSLFLSLYLPLPLSLSVPTLVAGAKLVGMVDDGQMENVPPPLPPPLNTPLSPG